MYIPWGENLSFVPKSRSNINVTVFKKLAVAGAFVFHKHILFQVVFKRLILQGHIKMWGLCDRVNPFPNKPWFLCVCSISLLKTLCS